jgi:hypothetical protein
MDKRLFTLLINSLKRQNDVDKELARKLTDAYDVDIFPPDNRILIDAITEVLRVAFPNNIETITFYCWEDNFGKVSGYSVEDLWNVLNGNVTQTSVPKFKDNWDDAENDVKYSKPDPKYMEMADSMEKHYLSDNYISFQVKQEYPPISGIENKVDDAIKNIEVQDFVVISPIKKFKSEY